MSFKDLSIKRKLILLQLLVVLAALLLFSILQIMNSARIYRESISVKLGSLADLLAYNCTSALNFQDKQDAAKTLFSLEAEAQVVQAWVLDASRRVFAEYAKPGRGLERPPSVSVDHEEEAGGMLTVSRRILQDGEPIGYVVLRYDLSAYRKMLAESALLAGGAFAVSVGIALVLVLLTHGALSGPLLRLVRVIERVSRTKDLSVRIPETRKDEMGVLYRGFNDMMAEIQSGEQETERAGAALRESEEKYRTLVEKANDGIVIIQDQRFVYANPSLAAMAGVPAEELIGRPFFQNLVDEEAPKVSGIYDNHMRGGESASTYETIFKTDDGRRISAEVSAALIPYQGRPADLVVIRNINERKKAEAEIRALNESLERRVEERTRELAAANERLIELDRLKSLFLASMSHELRTPLNSILGFTGLLLMGMSGPLTGEQSKQLAMVQSSASHLLGLINEILDISKIESGRVDLDIGSFSVAELVGETVKAVSPLAEGKGLVLDARIEGQPVLVSDRRRVKQVLVNLLGNAIKFSDQGTVRVEARAAAGELTVSVIDQGIGIRPEDLDKLFHAFGQIDMSSTKQYEGTGLGLYLCKKILDLIHGTISVASEYGRGSAFTFVLPLAWKEDPA